MARRIPTEVEVAIVRQWIAGRTSIRKLSLAYHVARGTVAAAIRRRTSKPKAPSDELVQYLPVPEYYCRGCKSNVRLRPCPACLCRQWRRERGHSPIEGWPGLDVDEGSPQ